MGNRLPRWSRSRSRQGLPALPSTRWRSAVTAMKEIVAVMAILLVMAARLFPALSGARQSGWRIRCLSNLRQLGLAAHLYWDDNENRAFRYRGASTNGGDIYWFGWIERGSEGQR